MSETKSITMAAKLPFISIIIPVYNGGPFFRECLKSIKELEYPPDKLELIVVDNNSTDGSGKLAEEMLAQFPFPARVLYEKDIQGSYAARNRGIQAAEGELLAFTDADCIADRDWLKNISSRYGDISAGCFAGLILSYAPQNLVERYAQQAEILRQEKTAINFSPFPFAQTANAAYRREVFESIGPFREELESGGDADFAWRMQKKTPWKVLFVPEAIVYHKHRSSVRELYRQFYRYEAGYIRLTELHKDFSPPTQKEREAQLLATIEKSIQNLEKKMPQGSTAGNIQDLELATPLLNLVINIARYRAHIDSALQNRSPTHPQCTANVFFPYTPQPMNHQQKKRYKKTQLDIGFIAFRDYYLPNKGDSIATHHLPENVRKLGHTIHVFEHQRNPNFVKYPFTPIGHLRLAISVDALWVNVEYNILESKFTNSLITRASRKKVLWHIHAPMEELQTIAGLDLNIMPIIIKDHKKAARHVHAAFCVSKGIVSYAREELGIKSAHYVPNGSDPEIFSPAKRTLPEAYLPFKNKVRVLWIGSPRFPWQGLNLIYRTARILLPREDIVFIFIGEIQDFRMPRLKNMFLFDSIPHHEAPPYIASADIGLCLYEPCPWSSYGFYFSPVKLFDYMASGLPVVASNLGEIPQIVRDGETGLLVSQEPAEIAKRILLLAGNPHLRARLGNAARNEVIRFYNWKRAARQIAEIIQELLDNRPS